MELVEQAGIWSLDFSAPLIQDPINIVERDQMRMSHLSCVSNIYAFEDAGTRDDYDDPWDESDECGCVVDSMHDGNPSLPMSISFAGFHILSDIAYDEWDTYDDEYCF